ncbi:MAG: CopG family transcriptional regulator [Deltaproteobacteria bacterium CG_4_10_14_3_um_filter_60_8]|nr:MAG: hypothetical protein AUK28_02545 [Desulfobacterales bacterium CG2_30_60_27]PIY20871.1 MAG: CopG family transcriptional regulator [Deltaproteobacteria bacterium CG_4_10_14_3_um_filter_60_8]
MTNITLSVDETIIKKVRKIAIEKNTSLTAMVREYLEQMAARDGAEKQRRLESLRKSLALLSRDMGGTLLAQGGAL